MSLTNIRFHGIFPTYVIGRSELPDSGSESEIPNELRPPLSSVLEEEAVAKVVVGGVVVHADVVAGVDGHATAGISRDL